MDRRVELLEAAQQDMVETVEIRLKRALRMCLDEYMGEIKKEKEDLEREKEEFRREKEEMAELFIGLCKGIKEVRRGPGRPKGSKNKIRRFCV